MDFKSSITAYLVGQRINSEEWNAITRSFEAADDTTRLGFGLPAVSGTGNHLCKLAAVAGAENFLGVTLNNPTLPRTDDGYARYDNVPICTDGVVAVPSEGNTTRGAQARFNTATGKWTAAAQSATVLTIPGVSFEEAATAPGISPVRIRVTSPAVTVVT